MVPDVDHGGSRDDGDDCHAGGRDDDMGHDAMNYDGDDCGGDADDYCDG